MLKKTLQLTLTKLSILTSVFLALFYNFTFFKKTLEIYPWSAHYFFFHLSLFIALCATFNIVINFLSFRHTVKPVIIIFLFLASIVCYFTDHIGAVMDDSMIENVINTNFSEMTELLSVNFLFTLFFLGLVPAFFIYKIKIRTFPLKVELKSKLKNISISLLLVFVSILSNSKVYASFFREHKPLRYYTNPTYLIYSSIKHFQHSISHPVGKLALLDANAKIPAEDIERELIIFVLGETARADRFSLNGYPRETNPLLKKEEVISFSQMYSCGTSTAVSVPCIFSGLGREHYDSDKAKNSENLLDLLVHTNRINVLWRDNNSDSKGVALRVPYEDFRYSDKNKVCDVECRDEGMLGGLQEYIDSKEKGDIFIVLHQMGNHGPAYYKRYPPKFEKFKPTCQTNQLDQCSTEQINNTYDNIILYTDYFLAKVIALLKKNDHQFETAMFYVSDHGESLGENGIYLHSLPYFLAPEEQKKVGSLLWFGESIKSDLDIKSILEKKDLKISHDYVFHTILGLMEVKSKLYNKKLDLISN